MNGMGGAVTSVTASNPGMKPEVPSLTLRHIMIRQLLNEADLIEHIGSDD